MSTQQTLTLHPLSAYTFTTKAAQPEEDPSVAARLQRLQNNYEDYGIRRTVEGVLVVHDHGHPHVLMIQIANAFFKLPGNYLRPDEDEVAGLGSKLDDQLAPDEGDPGSYGPGGASAGAGGDWEVGDCLAQWWRPAFETFMVSPQDSAKRESEFFSCRSCTDPEMRKTQYPYVPAHITKPKEVKKLFLVQMPQTSEYWTLIVQSLCGFELTK